MVHHVVDHHHGGVSFCEATLQLLQVESGLCVPNTLRRDHSNTLRTRMPVQLLDDCAHYLNFYRGTVKIEE
eukprot:1180749-Prorocentrum_minimum.AAC.2